RADLVRGVSVRRDAIRADDDEVDAAVTHEGRRHALGDDRRVDPVANELPGGEPRALEKRTGLVGKDGDTLAGVDGAADDAERRAVTGRGQRARVAVREDPRAVGHDLGAVRADGAAAGDV